MVWLLIFVRIKFLLISLSFLSTKFYMHGVIFAAPGLNINLLQPVLQCWFTALFVYAIGFQWINNPKTTYSY